MGSRNAGRQKDPWNVDGGVDGVGCDEEEMQRAIEASLKDSQKSHDSGLDTMDDREAVAGCNEKVILQGPPVVASGLGGCAWVDNSEFFRPRAKQFVKTHDVPPARFSRPRSIPCVVSVGSKNPGGRRTTDSGKGSSQNVRRSSEDRQEIRYQRGGEFRANLSSEQFNEHFHSCRDSRAGGEPIW